MPPEDIIRAFINMLPSELKNEILAWIRQQIQMGNPTATIPGLTEKLKRV